MGSHDFGFFGVRQLFIFTVIKRTRMFVLQMKSKESLNGVVTFTVIG